MNFLEHPIIRLRAARMATLCVFVTVLCGCRTIAVETVQAGSFSSIEPLLLGPSKQAVPYATALTDPESGLVRLENREHAAFFVYQIGFEAPGKETGIDLVTYGVKKYKNAHLAWSNPPGTCRLRLEDFARRHVFLEIEFRVEPGARTTISLTEVNQRALPDLRLKRENVRIKIEPIE